jgi:transcriptional regulator with XRE-family HTH domain
VIPKRRIARELKLLRESARLNLEEVARRTEVSTSTLSRLENAQGSANALTIRALVDFYDLAGTERGENLKLWAKAGRKQEWWQRFPEATTENINLYVAYESHASAAKLYLIPFLPVLLQTPEYSRAISEAFHPAYSREEVGRLVEFQLRRQEILARRTDGKPPLELHAILHESCLLQSVGSEEVMRSQLLELLAVMPRYPNVKINVLPMNCPAHIATRCSWSIFQYADEIDQDVTLLETHLGLVTQLLEEPSEVTTSAQHFSELLERSLDEQQSLSLIEELIKKRYS